MPADVENDPFLFLYKRENKDSFPDEIRRAIFDNKLVSVKSPQPSHYGRTLLHMAVWEDNRQAASFLIEHGADINALDDLHDSPFLLSGAEGREAILEMMLTNAERVSKYGNEITRKTSIPDFTVLNRYGGNALIPACERGHVGCVRLLLERSDIDVNQMNFYHWNGLLEAIEIGGDDKDHVEVIKLLIAHNADVNVTNAKGETALRIAKRMHTHRVIKLLEAADAHE